MNETANRRARATAVVRGAASVLTCAADARDLVGRQDGAVVAIAGERILAIGPEAELRRDIDFSAAQEIAAGGGVVCPGFVDCHTHFLFVGDRLEEYLGLIRGLDPAAMSRAGIPNSVAASIAVNRPASEDALITASLPRVRRMLEAGTTTIEVKSGYGLSPEADLRSLRAIRRIADMLPVDIHASYLGAHAIPPDVPKDRFLDSVLEEAMPRVAEEGLARFCDVYCDPDVFDLKETERVLARGLDLGLRPKMHTEANVNIGGSRLAADLGAVSVDHLNFTRRGDMRRLAEAGVAAVVLPGFDMIYGHARPIDARAMVEEGVTIALATDQCPVCWAESMQFVNVAACRLAHFTPAQSLRAATLGAATALGLQGEIGSLEPGKRADIVILDMPRFEHLAFRVDVNSVATVIVRGDVVVDRTAAA